MRSYSLAKLELLMLKWAMMEKIWDYILGFKFTIYIDNNPLSYVREGMLGVAQRRWLSKHVMFDFDITYKTGKSNKAAGTLSHHPYVAEEKDNNSDSEEYETISYAMACKELEINGEKLPTECKVAIQNEENKPA